MKNFLIIVLSTIYSFVSYAQHPCDTVGEYTNCGAVSPYNSATMCPWYTPDSICVGDSISIFVANANYCTNWSANTISWYLQGIAGPDSIHGSSITIIYPDTGTFLQLCNGAYDFSTFGSQTGNVIHVLPCPPVAAYSVDAQHICAGSCVQYSDQSTKVLGGSWHWYFAGGTPAFYDGKNPPSICYATAGSYSVSLAVRSRFGYDSLSHTHYIQVDATPMPQAAADTFSITYPATVTLDACAIGSSYQWLPAINGCNNCSSATITPNNPIESYSCIVSTVSGCTTTCHYHITVDGLIFESYTPNAFSPNGDGTNEVFQVFTSLPVQFFELKIYNRWGEKVYASNDVKMGWDGSYHGEVQPPDIYVYVVDIIPLYGGSAMHGKGSITLLR